MQDTTKVIVAVAALAALILVLVSRVDPHIPANAGGNVDVEIHMERMNLDFGRQKMLNQLSAELKKNPGAKRFRLWTRWSDCGVAGKQAIVYDRSTATLMNWIDGKHFKQWRGGLRQATYGGVQEKVIHKIGEIDYVGWGNTYRRSKNFDFLQGYGCTKMSSHEVKPIRFWR